MQKLLLPIFLFVFAFCFFSFLVSAQRNPPNPEVNRLRIGVLRSDGTIVPFAEYGNKIWWNPWPEITETDENNGPNPKSLSGHPEPWFQTCVNTLRSWYFWRSSDNRRILLARKVVQVENHGDKNWALLTDLPAAVADKERAHHKNIGLALTADLKFEGKTDIEFTSREATDAAAFIEPVFIKIENDEIERQLAVPEAKEFYQKNGFPLSQVNRSKVALELTSLKRSSSSIDARHLYYFQAEKKYSRPENLADWPCHHISEMSGWLLKEKDGRFNLINERFWLTDCDKKGGGSIETFNILKLDGRDFVFTVEHNYDNEVYVIYELEDFGLKTLLVTWGG